MFAYFLKDRDIKNKRCPPPTADYTTHGTKEHGAFLWGGVALRVALVCYEMVDYIVSTSLECLSTKDVIEYMSCYLIHSCGGDKFIHFPKAFVI